MKSAAKLYTTKTPITAADLLNDRMLPMYEAHALPLLPLLTGWARSTAAESSSTITNCSW